MLDKGRMAIDSAGQAKVTEPMTLCDSESPGWGGGVLSNICIGPRVCASWLAFRGHGDGVGATISNSSPTANCLIRDHLQHYLPVDGVLLGMVSFYANLPVYGLYNVLWFIKCPRKNLLIKINIMSCGVLENIYTRNKNWLTKIKILLTKTYSSVKFMRMSFQKGH